MTTTKRKTFDKNYYDRFYRDRRTRVTDGGDMAKLGAFVCSYLEHMDLPVESVLDMGCGLGHWQQVVRKHFPRASYTGVEVSGYLCRERGWKRGSVVDYRAGESYDLVICHGVLQYLRAADARRAIANLRRHCHGAMFLEVLTAEDWEHNCDRSVTDGDVYLRKAKWYRDELASRFTSCGGGVFVVPESGAALYELEKLG